MFHSPHTPGHDAYDNYRRLTHGRNWHGGKLTKWRRLDPHAQASWEVVAQCTQPQAHPHHVAQLAVAVAWAGHRALHRAA